MNCIIIDDEPLAAEILQEYIAKISFLRLQHTFNSATRALQYLQGNHCTDLIFLDINMPVLTGTQLIRTLTSAPQFIFTTAYDNFALEGFNLNATDYLLKPINFERFVKAINKANELKQRTQYAENGTACVNGRPFIFIKSDYKILRINLDEILFLESLKEYTRIHTIGKPVLTLKSMKEFEALLPARDFIRVHKSYMVAVNKISYIERKTILIKDKLIPIGQGYREQLLELLA
jgi:DNA-binding LytR/AlgR family response regulator